VPRWLSPGPESERAGAGRWSARRKTAVILELLHGADLESTSRKYRVTVATLTEWRDRFLAGGPADSPPNRSRNTSLAPSAAPASAPTIGVMSRRELDEPGVPAAGKLDPTTDLDQFVGDYAIENDRSESAKHLPGVQLAECGVPLLRTQGRPKDQFFRIADRICGIVVIDQREILGVIGVLRKKVQLVLDVAFQIPANGRRTRKRVQSVRLKRFQLWGSSCGSRNRLRSS